MRLLAGRTSPRWLQVCFLAAASSAAAAQDIGYRGASLAGSGPTVGFPTVTEAKPESKVWFHDGHWFASMWSAGSLEFRIHRLDPATHAWIDTGAAVEARPDSHSDALVAGNKLYIASHELAEGVGGPGDPLLVLRYSYNGVGDVYTLDAGFPVQVGDWSTETMVIERDSTGTLWAVWKQQSRVFFSRTLGADTTWSAPAILPGCTSDFTTDDICSVIAFGGNRIGVLWSDQTALNGYFFSSHLDGDPDTTWSPVEAALANESDDHLNLAADSAGRVYAVVKNRADEIKLLVRDGASWQQFLVGTKAEKLNRAIVLLDEEDQTVHVFATVVDSIVEKVAPMAGIAFPPGIGTPVMRDGTGAVVHNVTSTKQNFDSSTGLVVLASNVETTGNYWHHEVPPVPRGLVLQSPKPGRAGMVNAFVTDGATPGKPVLFYISPLPGSSYIYPPLCPGGIELGLTQPRRFGVVRASLSGVATLRMSVPASAAGRTFYFQSIEPFSCRSSNVVVEQF